MAKMLPAERRAVGVIALIGMLRMFGLFALLPVLALYARDFPDVTPLLIGRHLDVNPLLVFLALIFFLWMWGPIGGVVAIPLLVWTLAVINGLGACQTSSSGTVGKGAASAPALENA